MKLKINRRFYDVSTSFMTLVRYIAMTGKSFIKASALESQTLGDLAELMYCGIDKNKRPSLEIFLRECEADVLFGTSAFAYQKAMFSPTQLRSYGQSENEENNVDEITILALWTIAGLSLELLELFNIAQVSAMISEVFKIKSGKQSKHEMSPIERKQMYGITKDREKQISRYIRSGKNGI